MGKQYLNTKLAVAHDEIKVALHSNGGNYCDTRGKTYLAEENITFNGMNE